MTAPSHIPGLLLALLQVAASDGAALDAGLHTVDAAVQPGRDASSLDVSPPLATGRPSIPDAGGRAAPSSGAPVQATATAALPTSEPTASQPSSPAASVVAQLQALLDGTLPDSEDPRSLFATDLSEFSAVRRRVEELQRLLRDSRLAHQDLQTQLDAASRARQAVPRPAILDTEPEEPGEPAWPELGEPPVEPVPPAFRRAPRMIATRRAQWDVYDQAMAEHAQQLEAYQARARDLEQRRAEHARALQVYREAQQAQAQAAAEYRRQVQAVQANQDQLQHRVASSAGRLRELELRQRYLQAVQLKLEGLGAPALRGMVALGEPRAALRDQRQRVIELVRELEWLGQRIELLLARAQAGALVGFLVERERVEAGGQQARLQASQARAAGQALVDDLGQAAQVMEQEGRSLQTLILRAVTANAKAAALDRAFLSHLREMRRQRRLLGDGRDDASASDVTQLAGRLRETLATPDAVPSFAEAEQILARSVEQLGDLLALLDGRDAILGRWRLAYQRQLVATLEPLVSDTTRRDAYALSFALLSELQDELLDLLARAARYGRGRLQDAGQLLLFKDAAHSWTWFGWLAVTLVWIGVALWGRRFVPASVNALVRLVGRLRWLRGRMGLVVRWAGLLQRLAPTLLLLLIGELVLRALGLEHPEVQVLALLWRWAMLFVLGRQALVGATRRVSRGRPALIDVGERTVPLLHLTYDRLILQLVFTAAADDVVDRWLGSGQLRTLIRAILVVGVVAWVLWACLAWRVRLAEAWQGELAEDRPLRGWATWMRADKRGSLLSPLALLWIAACHLRRQGAHLSQRGGLSTFLRARELKRRARKASDEGEALLPSRYRDEFPLYPILGEEGALVLGRDHVVQPLLQQLARWRDTGVEGSLVLVGEKGMGKSTLCGLLQRQIREVEVLLHTLHSKVLDEAALVTSLAPVLGAAGVTQVEDLAQHLREGGERVIIVDDAHNLFLRVVDGYRGFDAMVQLCNATGERVFWVLVFNRYAWKFINQSRKREHYFRRIVEMPRWSAAELQELISVRNRRSGFAVRFSELLLDDEAGPSDAFQLIEGAEGFFRLLWEQSRGNPRLATHLWLSALRPVDEQTLEVGLFRAADASAFDKLGDDLWFALAAICQHENLSTAELRDTLNVSADFASFAVAILREYGFVEAKRTSFERITLSPRYFRQVLDRLRSKHLLFEA